MLFTDKHVFATGALILATACANGSGDVLLNHWPLDDGNTYQRDGNTWVKDIVGGADGNVRDATVAGGSLRLDGAGDCMQVPGLRFPDSFAIEAVVRIDPRARNIQTIIANAGPTADTDGFKVFVNHHDTTDGAIGFESGNGIGYMGQQVFSPAGTFQCSDTDFQKVRVEVNQEEPLLERVRIFYNGQLVATGCAADFARDNGRTDVGRMLVTWYLWGEIADLRVIPEPATIALIAFGGMALVHRRRSRARGVRRPKQAGFSRDLQHQVS